MKTVDPCRRRRPGMRPAKLCHKRA